MHRHISSKGNALLIILISGAGAILTLFFIAPPFFKSITNENENKESRISLAEPYATPVKVVEETPVVKEDVPTTTPSAKPSVTVPDKKIPVQKSVTKKIEPSPQLLVPTSTTPTQTLQFPEKYLAHTTDELDARQIIYLTNQERQKDGKSLLRENTDLNQAATAKVNHLFDNQYFEHVAPVTGEDVVYWVGKVDYMYISVGENLAMGGFRDEEEMVTAWMNSPGHRANILKSSYEEIGVAVGRGNYKGNIIWMGVQVFGVPASSCPAVDKNLLATIDTTEALMKKIEKDLGTMYPIISGAPQPKTQEEYNTYISMVTQYNNLVAQQKSVNLSIAKAVDTYNKEVQEYNACLSNK